MPEPEAALLRREMHGMHEEHEREGREWESGMEAAMDDNLGLRNAAMELRIENADLRRRLAYYENAHTPPSKRPLPPPKPKGAGGAGGGGGAPVRRKGSPGRKPGHEGVSATRRAQRTGHHVPARCARCGGGDLRRAGSWHKNVTDMPRMPGPATACHVMHRCACNGCGAGVRPPPPGIEGTGIGPNLAAPAVKARGRNASVAGVADCPAAFGARISRGGVQHLLEACGRRMEAEAGRIRAGLEGSDANRHGETGASPNGRDGRVRCGVAAAAKGGFAAVAVVAGSRGRAVPDGFFPGWRSVPATTDGLSVYALIEIRQACMAHVMRDSKHASSGSRQAHMLHVRPKEVYRRARELAGANGRGPPGGPGRLDAQVGRRESEAPAVADEHGRLGSKFGTTLRNAAPHMFVFVRRPHMAPTNNPAGRMIRPVVVARAVRGKMVTAGGMRMFGTLMTCLLAWERRGDDVTAKLLEVPG